MRSDILQCITEEWNENFDPRKTDGKGQLTINAAIRGSCVANPKTPRVSWTLKSAEPSISRISVNARHEQMRVSMAEPRNLKINIHLKNDWQNDLQLLKIILCASNNCRLNLYREVITLLALQNVLLIEFLDLKAPLP